MFNLISVLSVLLSISCVMLILLVLIQKGKSSMGLGGLGGGSQMLFGGSGGQDMFQKATWIFGAVLIFGSLGLALLKSQQASRSQYTQEQRAPEQK